MNACTSGFMSVERMDAVLGNLGDTFKENDFQGIFPEVGFTCSGTLLSWVFGAKWEGNSQSFTEIQIWRPVGEDGVFRKVGSTTIMTPQNQSNLYYYPLSSPLAFQAGDVLGYYQPPSENSQLRLLFENDRRGDLQLGYYYYNQPSSPSTLDIRQGAIYRTYQIFINVVTGEYEVISSITSVYGSNNHCTFTDKSECECGFVSVERMRLAMGNDVVAGRKAISSRQQVTPAMTFTCDGMITRWIIGAEWNGNNTHFPELQVWRNIGNSRYQKINGTTAELPTSISTWMYTYTDFTPVPVQAGDILGIFIPRNSRLSLLSETTSSPTNYYLSSGEPSDNIDLQSYMVESFHPLVSAVISKLLHTKF